LCELTSEEITEWLAFKQIENELDDEGAIQGQLLQRVMDKTKKGRKH